MTDLALAPAGAALEQWQPAALWIAGSNTLATRRARLSACRQFVRRAASADAVVPDAGAVRPAHVLAWKADMVDRGLAPRTIRQRLLILSGFFEWAIGEGYHPGPNPVAHVPLPSVGREPVGLALDTVEVAALVAAAEHSRDRALLWLLADGGLRAAELCALEERDARLHGAAACGSGELLVRAGKGGRPRTVTLTAAAAAVLGEYVMLSPSCAGGRRLTGPTSPLLQRFHGQPGGIAYGTVYRVVRECAARAGLGHVAPHDLRRTYATLALDLGRPAPAVQRQMGHRSMDQTVRYYRESR